LEVTGILEGFSGVVSPGAVRLKFPANPIPFENSCRYIKQNGPKEGSSMSALSVQGVTGSANQQVQAGMEPEQPDLLGQLRQEQEDADLSLNEMIREGQEKARAQREALNVPRNTRYGDAPLEAYARLARAKTKMQVNSASGFARRKIAQLKSALRTDSGNAIRIKGSIRQLEKAISRGEKKKKELDRERLAELRKARSEAQKKREELELRRRKTQRMIREAGYLREAEIANRQAAQLTATQMELRQQAQQLANITAASAEAAAQQYSATASAVLSAETAAPAEGLNLEG